MKSLVLAFILAFSANVFAESSLEASKGSELQVLDLVVGVHQTYSQTSELEAKAVEVLAGDGMNAIRMILVLRTGYEAAKIYEIQEMMSSVRRITFLAKDVVVINYIQDSFDNADDMNPIQVNKSVTIKVLRNADGSLADKIEIL